MQKTKWAHLPNAAHIDRILAHVKAHPDKWYAAWDAARVVARGAAWNAVYYASRGAARDAVYDAARGAAWGAAWDAVWGVAPDAAWGACAALIAWDEVGDLLSAPVATVRFLAQEQVPAAVLLLPAVIAMEGSLDTVK